MNWKNVMNCQTRVARAAALRTAEFWKRFTAKFLMRPNNNPPEETDAQKQMRAQQCSIEVQEVCERFRCELIAHVQVVGIQVSSAVIVHVK